MWVHIVLFLSIVTQSSTTQRLQLLEASGTENAHSELLIKIPQESEWMSIKERSISSFWLVHDWMLDVMSRWPNFAVLGFTISWAAALLSLPFFLIFALLAIWSVAAMGPARKTFSSILVIVVSVIVYPLVTLIILVIVWFAFALAALAFSIVAPISVVGSLMCLLGTSTFTFMNEQRRETPIVDDIGFMGLLVGLVLGLLTLCTFGILTVGLTLIKAPVVLVASTVYGIYYTLPAVFETGCCCPAAFIAWVFCVLGGVVVLAFSILLSAIVKFVVSLVWPAYVATGWLRHFGGGGRRTSGTCFTPFVQGFKAGYQVLWASDLLTNACIRGRFDLLLKAKDEFLEIATGQRESLSPDCRKISCLPPVTIGLYQGGSWDMAEELVARQFGVKKDKVQEAWNSLAQQMKLVGRGALASGLLNEDYVMSVPPELVIGLPARVLLDTVERSDGSEIELASGLKMSQHRRPHGKFADLVWDKLQQARVSLPGLAGLGAEGRVYLCGLLLAGGGDPAGLPPNLGDIIRNFDTWPEESRELILSVHRPLIGIASECGQQSVFREKLKEVILELSSDMYD